MAHTENTPPSYSTGREVPKNLRVSRCITCDRHYAWKGSAARPACPFDGGHLTTTTRVAQRPFLLLEGRLLVRAELMPNGLEAAAAVELARAARVDASADEVENGIADGTLVQHEKYPECVHRPGSYSLRYRDTSSLRASAEKHRAKAAGYTKRAAKLAATFKVEA